MKKLNNKGFSGIEALLIVVILGMIAGVGWYVYSQNQQTKQTDSTNESSKASQITEKPADFVYKEAIEDPVNWKTFENNELGFGFRYPEEYKIKEGTFKDGESADKASYYASASMPVGQGGYEVRILETSLEEAVKNDPLNVNDNAFKSTIKQKMIYKSGYKGIELSYVPDTGKVSWFFIEKDKDTVFVFTLVEDSGENAETSKTIYNSFQIR